jgi:hypothetical protein
VLPGGAETKKKKEESHRLPNVLSWRARGEPKNKKQKEQQKRFAFLFCLLIRDSTSLQPPSKPFYDLKLATGSTHWSENFFSKKLQKRTGSH